MGEVLRKRESPGAMTVEGVLWILEVRVGAVGGQGSPHTDLCVLCSSIHHGLHEVSDICLAQTPSIPLQADQFRQLPELPTPSP